jgi:predicted transcriptional regulator
MEVKLKTPYLDLVPPLSTDEQSALRSDIKRNGILIPIFIDELGNILDGHHRNKLAPRNADRPTVVIEGLTDEQKQAFVFRSINARRNLSREQRATLRKEMQKKAVHWRESDHKFWTQKRIADELGVDQKTVSNWFISNRNQNNANNKLAKTSKKKDAREKLDKDDQSAIVELVNSGKPQSQVAADFGVSQGRVSQIVKRDKSKKAKDANRAKAKQIRLPKNNDLGVKVGDWRESVKELKADSVELIFTDPPYFTDCLPHYESLAIEAARVLVDGGSLITYCGHALIPKILTLMDVDGLKFYWMCACVHTGQQATMPLTGQRVGWKPLLWFVKGKQRFDTSAIVPDTVISKQEKTDHPWQQSVKEAGHFIEKLSGKGGLVFDPFCGGGTTAAVAKQLGRRWFTCEIDKEVAKSARERIHAQR